MIKLTNLLREMEDNKFTIYCDMDGVLVDFDKGYKELTGISTEEADAKGPESFWKPITDAGVSFWTKLKWMPDGKELWDYIKKYDPPLLSAPSRNQSSRVGKHIWVEQNLPGTKLILRPANEKQQFSGENQILIDDKKNNIDRWKSKGGIGILHTSSSSTIKKLKELGL
jgi:hypothetical protein